MKNLSYKYQKPSYQLPKKRFVQKYPRAFGVIFITTCIGTLYSRQIYDIFFRPEEDFYNPAGIPPTYRR